MYRKIFSYHKYHFLIIQHILLFTFYFTDNTVQ